MVLPPRLSKPKSKISLMKSLVLMAAAVILVGRSYPVVDGTVNEVKNIAIARENSFGLSHTQNTTVEIIRSRESGVTTDLLNDEILPRLTRIKSICGVICEVDSKEAFESVISKNGVELLFPEVRVPIDCGKLMTSEDIDVGETSVPYPLPSVIKHLYSLNGAIEILDIKRYVNVYLGGKHNVEWDEELISNILIEIENGTHSGTYGVKETNEVRNHLKKTVNMEGARVLVIGSERPWLEAICLFLGAKEVVTLEYGQIVSSHPKLKTLVPSEFREKYMERTLGQFDAVVSYSSMEHSGLGRYGDALNPWGDILAVARAWCVTRPQGALVLGVPTGRDAVHVNAHRVYGRVRWPLITANWRQVDGHLHSGEELDASHWKHSIMVFKKIDNS